jgi:phosphomannomutase
MMTQDKECTISELVADLPSRYTKSDRIKDFPTEMSQQLLQKMMSASNDENLKNIDILFHDVAGKSVTIDSTDGIRIMFENEDIIHLRPSGNAPELRCYNESATVERAEILNMRCMTILESWKNND